MESKNDAMPIETLADLLDMYQRKFKPEKAEDIDATIQLSITGEGGGEHTLVIHDQTLTISDGQAENPDLTVTCDFDNWLKMNLGEANPMVLMMSGKMKVKGSVPMAMKFQQLFF